MYIWDRTFARHIFFDDNPLTLQGWSLIQKPGGNYIEYVLPFGGLGAWTLLFVNVAGVQGPLTLGLHCSELIANVIRDERQWRCATRRQGLRVATNSLKPIFTHPLCLVLFIAKPFLRESFTPSILLSFLLNIILHDHRLDIWNLCIALFIFACFFTFVALRRPCGPQPAAYGDLQTLANLVDEWSPVMWWGHKEDGIPYCHAGTSDHPLPDVKMDCVYAGSVTGSLVPLS
ncbi:hypothetical protein C8R48DRAFT_715795 [Suillus tomentosus]|nr:hypothetical protein C8R48DRAFT_715795 [Suillus tomentosus]